MYAKWVKACQTLMIGLARNRSGMQSMPEIIYLLQPDGNIEELQADKAADYKCLDGETDPATVTLADVQANPLVIAFNGAADGRGFSFIKAIRHDAGYRDPVYASGHINPDQLSLAFQCRFDGVLVGPDRWESYGSDTWQSALNPLVNLSYAQTESQPIRSIWQQRH